MLKEQIQRIHAEGESGKHTFNYVAVTVAAVAVVVVTWAMYLSLVLFDFDVLNRGRSGRSPTNPTLLLVLAILATVVAPAWAILHVRKLRYLSTHRKQVRGKILQTSAISKHGMTPATIVYNVDGKEFRIRKDMAKSDVASGSDVMVIYDPSNPMRAQVQPL